jgi:hypothetical protein
VEVGDGRGCASCARLYMIDLDAEGDCFVGDSVCGNARSEVNHSICPAVVSDLLWQTPCHVMDH